MAHVVKRVVSLCALLLLAPLSWAGQLEDGSAALEEGRFEDAFALLLPLAEKGNAFAQYNVGVMYAQGAGTTRDEAEAVRWYTLAAEQGDVDSITNLGLMYAEGRGVEQDHVRAVQLYTVAAEAGNGLAQNNLGSSYLFGNGVEQSNHEAFRLFATAAKQDIAMAQNSLAVLYCEGRDGPEPIERDSEKCTYWMHRAAAQGYEQARVNIFRMTLSGANDGDLQAQHNVGAYYLQGFGTEQNPVEGVRRLTLAAEAGVENSQRVLVQLYEQGAYGVAPNAELAAYWRAKLAEQAR